MIDSTAATKEDYWELKEEIKTHLTLQIEMNMSIESLKAAQLEHHQSLYGGDGLKGISSDVKDMTHKIKLIWGIVCAMGIAVLAVMGTLTGAYLLKFFPLLLR